MRHRVEKRRLGRTSAHRDAMLRNMVTSLLEHERIETTEAKAKEVRRIAEKMITLAKKGDLHSYRRALQVIRKKEVAKKLFEEKAILFADRQGGYTRILKLGQRPGDNADMALIELVERTPEKKAKKAEPKGQKKSAIETARAAVSKKGAAKAAPKKAAPKKAAPKKAGLEKEKKAEAAKKAPAARKASPKKASTDKGRGKKP